jgi:hypothetical protein
MTILYPTSSGVPDSALIDSWSKPDMYQDPLQTDMDGGNKRLRTRPGDGVQKISFDILMSQAQFSTFETWVLTTCGRGTAQFQMRVWLGAAYATKLVQFAAKPKADSRSKWPKVVVTFELWVLQ